MNVPPKQFIRVPHERLHRFVSKASQTVGLSVEKAELLAGLLTANDLRGVFSHGTQQIATYAILMRDGKLNNHPDIKVIKETASSVLVDGDGGLGYFPAHDGTNRAIEKARNHGMAVMVSRNHGHFGAAGLYTRMTLEHDLITYVTSGAQTDLQPATSILRAGSGSPMSFSAPAGDEDPLVLDFGVMHDLYGPHGDNLAKLAPGLVLRCIGMGEICQSWGALLSGLTVSHESPRWTFPGANQGSMLFTFRIDLFLDPASFKQELDEFVRRVRQLKPLESFDQAYVAGGIEATRNRQYRQEGVPVGPEHQQNLERVAQELGITVPWEEY